MVVGVEKILSKNVDPCLEEKVVITLNEYRELLDVKTRRDVVIDLCNKDKFISFETLMGVLGGELNEDKA